MEVLILIISVLIRLVICTNLPEADNVPQGALVLPSDNSTDDPNKEMYVIHAMVYQVGILTNKTESDENITGIAGNQEAVTFYHTNGSNIDLSHIPEPLVTNVTAQRLVGVAPTTSGDGQPAPVSWAELKKLAASQSIPEQSDVTPLHSRRATDEENGNYEDGDYMTNENMPYLKSLYKRSLEAKNQDFDKSPVKIVSGAAVIPQEAAVHSIGIPPLLMFNNNFSEIPVPIPNTSVVHYAKVNTVIHHTDNTPEEHK